MHNIRHSSHPLIKHLINTIRDHTLSPALFRKNIALLAQYLLFEAMRQWPLRPRRITTWIGEMEFGQIEQKELAFIPILRAGIPMMEGVLEVLPEVPVGFLAMKRDEQTFEPTIFYKRFPKLQGKTAILLDPMVATGGSLSDAIDVVKKENPKDILSLNLIAAPQGLEHVSQKHPDVTIHIAQIDEKLDSRMFIHPGLGDAGDRAFNTEEE